MNTSCPQAVSPFCLKTRTIKLGYYFPSEDKLFSFRTIGSLSDCQRQLLTVISVTECDCCMGALSLHLESILFQRRPSIIFVVSSKVKQIPFTSESRRGTIKEARLAQVNYA